MPVDTDFELMEKVIQFIYSGEIEFFPQEVSDLLEISKKVN
jgi:hypothetical protein